MFSQAERVNLPPSPAGRGHLSAAVSHHSLHLRPRTGGVPGGHPRCVPPVPPAAGSAAHEGHPGARPAAQGGAAKPVTNYQFMTADGSYRINLTQDFISLTCAKYDRWEAFARMMDKPLASFIRTYHPAYFQRVGLRYLTPSPAGISTWRAPLAGAYGAAVFGASGRGGHAGGRLCPLHPGRGRSHPGGCG